MIEKSVRANNWNPNCGEVAVLPFDAILLALRRLRRLVRVGAGGRCAMAQCPAHPDSTPSLSVAETDDSSALIHCHAGCTAEQIVEALGLEMSNLFPSAYALAFSPHAAQRRQSAKGDGCADNVDAEPSNEHCRVRRKLLREFEPDSDALAKLARRLDLSKRAVSGHGIRYDPNADVFLVPERDGRGRIVGILARSWDACKRECMYLRGDRRGLFVPRSKPISTNDVLYLTEGVSDCLALCELGKWAIARPMARTPTSIFRWLCEWLKRHEQLMRIAVVGDNDPLDLGSESGLGEREAKCLARSLKGALPDRSIRAVVPIGFKDVREQVTTVRTIRLTSIWP